MTAWVKKRRRSHTKRFKLCRCPICETDMNIIASLWSIREDTIRASDRWFIKGINKQIWETISNAYQEAEKFQSRY